MGLNNTHSSWEKLFLSSTTEADGFNSFSSFNMTRGGGGGGDHGDIETRSFFNFSGSPQWQFNILGASPLVGD